MQKISKMYHINEKSEKWVLLPYTSVNFCKRIRPKPIYTAGETEIGTAIKGHVTQCYILHSHAPKPTCHFQPMGSSQIAQKCLILILIIMMNNCHLQLRCLSKGTSEKQDINLIGRISFLVTLISYSIANVIKQ